MAVTKGIHAAPPIVKALVESGISLFGDSRLSNLAKIRKVHPDLELTLLRPPMLAEISRVLEYSDVSFNSEIEIVRRISEAAVRRGVKHGVIISLEVGDKRDGVLPRELSHWVSKVAGMSGVTIRGISGNFACNSRVRPTQRRLDSLKVAAMIVSDTIGRPLRYVSIGNSICCRREMEGLILEPVNTLRLGEGLFLGTDGLDHRPIRGLWRDAFVLNAEIIEVRGKGEGAGLVRGVLALGRTDGATRGIKGIGTHELISITSDHSVFVTSEQDGISRGLRVGGQLGFLLDYDALRESMASSYVRKHYVRFAPP